MDGNSGGTGHLPPGGEGEVLQVIPVACPVEPTESASESARAAPPEPFSTEELKRACARPHLIIEYVLGRRDRLAANLSTRRGLWGLIGLLFLTSLAATVPYSLLSPTRSAWKIAVLYTGSMLICFPCLHVWAQFFGFRHTLAQDLALSLVLTSVAALFTFGFFPVIWFIDSSTEADPATEISAAALSLWLLGIALLMGIIHMTRVLVKPNGLLARQASFSWLLMLWLPLLVFIVYRMGKVIAVF